MRHKPIISARPRRPSLANYEQKLRKLRTIFALVVEDIDDALEQLARERKQEAEEA